ncbi:MAG TPA: hypothetical protein VIY27_02245 [Myxococcota bacterium]
MNAELLTHAVTITASFGVGLPILRKAWRAQDRVGTLLALSLVLDGLEWSFWALHLYLPASSPALRDGFATACRLGISAAVLCMGLFTWRAFRPRSRTAQGVLGLLVAAMALGFVGSGMVGDWRGFRSDHPWIWLEVGAQILIYGWACAESLTFYLRLRKRVNVGLGDPVLANRFLLWALYAGGFFVSQIAFALALASPDGYTNLDPLSIALTLLGVGALWLAFFPPTGYRAWLRGGHAPS